MSTGPLRVGVGGPVGSHQQAVEVDAVRLDFLDCMVDAGVGQLPARLALALHSAGDRETRLQQEIILGVLDLADMTVERPETVAQRIRRALPFVPAERIIVAPDCGLKYLPREVAVGKLKSMVAGAVILRAEMARRTGPVRVQSNS